MRHPWLKLGIWLVLATSASAQVEPGGAFLRSLIVPGWGHNAVDPHEWNAGKVHLAADIVLIASYFGYDARSTDLQRSLNTQANLYAGATLAGRSRAYRIAIADYENLEAFNDAMERSRNWDRILPDTPQNQWHWSDEDARKRFIGLINDEDAARNRLPAITAMIVANRIFAGVGAYRRSRNVSLTTGLADGQPSFHLRVGF